MQLPVINNCDGCGACCTEQAALPVSWYVGIYPSDEGIPSELRAELVALRDKYMLEGFPSDGSACIWYDPETRRCKHYEHRPQLCRDSIKVGDESCRWIRRKAGIDPRPAYRYRNGRLEKSK